MKFHMFQAVRLSINRSLFTVHTAMVYVIQVCRQLSSRNILVLLESSLQACMTYISAECTVNRTPDDEQRKSPKHVILGIVCDIC